MLSPNNISAAPSPRETTPPRKALVLGATGGIGHEMAKALIKNGWQIVALCRRNPDADQIADFGPDCRWVVGDAMKRTDVMNAAKGAELIVHAVNPPGYRDWDKVVLPMIDNSIAAACENRARIFLPGTVYNYGPDAFPLIDEDSPQHPVTRKGKIRVEMENRLRAATSNGARVLILRAGDFFGPDAKNNYFSQALVMPGEPVRRILNPGRAGIGHQWAYLPDVAATAMALIARENALPDFARFHFGGHWDEDGSEMITAIERATGTAKLSVRRFPWRIVGLIRPFNRFLRELYEMKYLWQQPVRLDNRKLLAFLGHEPHTPLNAAVTTTLSKLGCLPKATETAAEKDRSRTQNRPAPTSVPPQ